MSNGRVGESEWSVGDLFDRLNPSIGVIRLSFRVARRIAVLAVLTVPAVFDAIDTVGTLDPVAVCGRPFVFFGRPAFPILCNSGGGKSIVLEGCTIAFPFSLAWEFAADNE